MTTPQKMPQENTPADEQAPDPGILYKILTRLIAWTMFVGFITLIGATLVFIALALWRGIVWLWPGGAM